MRETAEQEQDAIPPCPALTNEDALRDWRMAHNRESYERSDSYHEGFAGIVGVTTDWWCKCCKRRIDAPHLRSCPAEIIERRHSLPVEGERDA